MAKWYAAGFWFGIYNGKLRFYRGSTTFVESTTAIPINRWTHIAVNSYYDAWDNAYISEFYINGDLDGYQLHTGAGAVGGTYDLHIGNDQSVEYFVGDIAEARIWFGGAGRRKSARGHAPRHQREAPRLDRELAFNGRFQRFDQRD